MAFNNTALYDSAMSAIADCNGAWITDSAPTDYSGQLTAAKVLATEVDLQIPTIITGVTISQRQLLESIVKSVMINRTPVNVAPVEYLSIANAIAALFTEFSTDLQNDSPGQYVFSVPNLATLALLEGVVFGQKIRVETVGRSYEFAPNGTTPVDGIVGVAGIGGVYHSLEGTSDGKWLSQPVWSIDVLNGNDENEGSALAPLASTEELQRRLGPDPVLTIMIAVHYVNLPDVNILHASRAANTSGFVIDSIPEDLVVSTVGSYTPKNPATNEGYLVTSPDVADWTPYLGCRLLVNGNAVAFVFTVNPDGSGVGTARVSPFYRDTGLSGTLTNPVVGQTLIVQRLKSCSTFVINVIGGRLNDAADAAFVPAVRVSHVAVSKQIEVSAPAGINNIRIFGCDVVDLQFPAKGAGARTIGTRERYAQVNIPQHYARGVLFDKSPYEAFGDQYRFATTDIWNTALQECVLNRVGFQISVASVVSLQSCQAFEWSTSAVGAIEASDGASVYLLVNFSGRSANAGTYGLKCRTTSTVIYNALTATAAGAAGEIICMGVAGAIAWASRPRSWAGTFADCQLLGFGGMWAH